MVNHACSAVRLSSTSGSNSFLQRLFDTTGFPPRWQCGTWSSELGWLHIVSDCAIFVSYAAIPTALLIFIARRRDVPLRAIFWLFIAFILSCGLTHLTDAVMFYKPAYRFLGLMKAVTAVVSLTTVFALIRVLPHALSLPALVAQHRTLQQDLSRGKEVEASLEKVRAELETRSAALTARERQLTSAMVAGQVAAVKWNAETLQIDWEFRAHELLLAPRKVALPLRNWSMVLDDVQSQALRTESSTAIRSGRSLAIEFRIRLNGEDEKVLRLTAAPEQVNAAGEWAIIGMFRLI